MRIAVVGATGIAGRAVAALAHLEGHDVVEICRSRGVDLLDRRSLKRVLTDVDAIVDCCQSPTRDERDATSFFERAAGNLGSAAIRAGVQRTVGLSIVGVDRTPDYGYYVAKTNHERALRTYTPGAVILRATQFHEFAAQMLAKGREGDTARIIDVPTAPIAVEEVARTLLDLATGSEPTPVEGVVEVAGPRTERLVDQVGQLLAHLGEHITITPTDAPASMMSGSMLPRAGARQRGPSYTEWLARQPVR